MTTIVNYFITNYINAHPIGALSSGIAIVVALLLLSLLAEKVLLDAYEGKPIEYKTQAFAIVILPLLFTMGFVVIVRLAQILHVL